MRRSCKPRTLQSRLNPALGADRVSLGLLCCVLLVAAPAAMFEGDQAQLEKFSDHLHEMIEKPVEELLTEAKRKDIQNYTTVRRDPREPVAFDCCRPRLSP